MKIDTTEAHRLILVKEILFYNQFLVYCHETDVCLMLAIRGAITI